MTKVEIEKPIVSKELAERFEYLRENCPFIAIDLANYSTEIKEKIRLNNSDFSLLLAKMFVVEYEIEKPKLFYIELSDESKLDVEKGRAFRYLNLGKHSGKYFLSDKSEDVNVQVKFTKAEAETFIKSEPKGMWVVEEVEDQ